jgi:hypothetical protein
MGRFENNNQMSEMPMEGAQVARPVYTNYLKKGAGQQKVLLRRKEFRARRGDELRSLFGQQQRVMPMQQQFGMQQFGMAGLGAQPVAAAAGGFESRLLSKPPLRHWGYEAAIVQQPDIDQAPNYKRRVLVRRERTVRIHRMRRGVAWSIPVYDRERHEKGGLSWTVPLDSNFYAEEKGTKKKNPKSKSLLKRFASGVKRVFKGTRATTKQPKITVRPQQRLAARKHGAPFVARSDIPPQAPVVEKRRQRLVENTTGLNMRNQEAFGRAPAVVMAPGAPAVQDCGVIMNGRRIHTTHLSEVPLMRQAPAADYKDESAGPKKASARHSAATPIVHQKSRAITSQQEQQLQHVHTG